MLTAILLDLYYPVNATVFHMLVTCIILSTIHLKSNPITMNLLALFVAASPGCWLGVTPWFLLCSEPDPSSSKYQNKVGRNHCSWKFKVMFVIIFTE